MSRVAERADYPDPVRLRLLEGDLDEQDTALDRFAGRLEALDARWDTRFSKVLWAMIGVLISFTTASVLLAANLVVG